MSHESSVIKSEPKKVLKNASLMSLGTLLSRVLGLLRDMVLGALFDRIVTDAWTAAFRVPNLFRRLFGEGALSVSFIPEFIEVQAQDLTGKQAKNFANAVYSLLLIFLIVLTVSGFIFIEPLFKLLLSADYVLDPQRWELTVRLGRIMFGFVFFICQFAFFMGLLNALGSFALPAAAPALLNISMLVFTVMPQNWFAQPADGLGWGVLVGGIAQSVILWFALSRFGYLPRLTAAFLEPRVLNVFKRMLPSVLGVGVLQIVTLVNLYFASSLQAGALSYIYWADRLLELPLSLVSVSLGTAMLPSLSKAVAEGDKDSFRANATSTILMNLYFAIPCALGLFYLAEPIVEVLFYRGKFSLEDLMMTAQVVKIYGLSLVVISLTRVLAPLFFAHKDTITPMVGALMGLIVHLVAAPKFMVLWGLMGLIYSVALMSTVNLIWLFIRLPQKTLGINFREIGPTTFKILVSGGALALTAHLYNWGQAPIGSHQNIFWLFLVIVCSGGVYFVTSYILKTPESKKVKKLLLRK